MINIETKQKLLIDYAKKITKYKEKIEEYEALIQGIEKLETDQTEIK